MPSISNPSAAHLVISIVSHGHSRQIQALLDSLVRLRSPVVSRVVLTLNLPEAEPHLHHPQLPFVLEIIRNPSPRGFGANHNKALWGEAERFVCVLNPDVLLDVDPFPAMVHALTQERAGCSYPVQIDEQGQVQDSERETPSPLTLLRRRLLGRTERRVDWVNAACLVLPASVWRDLDGFDERYFMYCEDVDFCLRLRLRGLRLVKAPVHIIHAGERASGRRLNHLAWHVRSLLRLWRSPVYRQAQHLLTEVSATPGSITPP